jgi:uncharacterized protein DUF3800
MINFDTSYIRKMAKLLTPSADFDSSFTFYYDETNNIRKFYVKESGFNYSFTSNFVLGGIVYQGTQPDIKPLFDELNLQKTIKEVKLRHIAKGDFLDCLKSEKLTCFLKYLLDSEMYIHYSNLNILYWSLVDIVDSAIVNSEAAMQLPPSFVNHLRNDLYKLAKLEIDSVIKLFYNFEYPNIKSELVLEFIESLTSLFDEYLQTEEFHFGLESLRQILKEAKRKGSLPFIMDEEDYILINNFSQFYLNPIYLFKNSYHIFDNEISISEIVSDYKIFDGDEEIKNYSFIDSQSNLFIQSSDIFAGLFGKLTNYLNTSPREKIIIDFDLFSKKQLNNIDLLIDLEDKSHNKNIGFLQTVDSYEEMSKMSLIREIRNKAHI